MNLINYFPKRVTRRGIQIALGIIWLLDGVLQLQHQMFSSAFGSQVIAAAGQNQPLVVYGPINFELHILFMHPAIFDAFFAVIQLLIGILILRKKNTRIGLFGSVLWGLGVWWMGEGFGGLLSGHASLLTGAPGAALIYSILALAVLPKNERKNKKASHPAYWIPVFWAALWVMGAFYQLLPGQNTATEVANTIGANAQIGAPGWLSALDIHVSNFISGKGFTFIVTLAFVEAAIGILIFFPGYLQKIAVIAGIIMSLEFWFVGQSLGTYFSGLATDPNSAPLFILLGVTVLGSGRLSLELVKRDVRSFSMRAGQLLENLRTVQQPNADAATSRSTL